MTKLYHAWIWFWYRDLTRMLFVLVPSYFIILIPFLYWIGVKEADTFKGVLTACYILVFTLALIFNDYTNLEKIGRDVNGKKIKKS